MVELTIDLLKPLARTTILTPLGIRFWDPARDAQVSDNLLVTARPAAASRPTTTAFCTRSGIYAFQGLPGLRAREYPTGEPTFDASPAGQERFVVEVRDCLGRFLPALFEVDAPRKGVYPTDTSGSPPQDGPPGFYLFSAPTRTASPGFAVVRGDLVERASGSPAAHARVEIQVAGKTWYGIADGQGRVAVLFPYPRFIGGLGGSPPAMPLPQQRWPLNVEVRHSPATLVYPPDAKIPSLRSILEQTSTFIWDSQAGPPSSTWSADLTYGQELVMRTANLHELLVGPDASPP